MAIKVDVEMGQILGSNFSQGIKLRVDIFLHLQMEKRGGKLPEVIQLKSRGLTLSFKPTCACLGGEAAGPGIHGRDMRCEAPSTMSASH